jgi:hypothetical protein
MTPLIFSRYVREGRVFSATPGMQERARELSRQGAALVGPQDWERPCSWAASAPAQRLRRARCGGPCRLAGARGAVMRAIKPGQVAVFLACWR